MGKRLYLLAPAKINLHLEVLRRRKDGYHDIVSLFQAVSLYDEIELRSLKKKNAYRLEGDISIPAEDNIITKAVELFRQESGNYSGIEIGVQKHIPVGAGLGGGSSDAAAVLIGLDRFFSVGLSTPQLLHLAERLGSDVPFFLRSAAALVQGRGEMVTPIEARSDYFLVLIFPGFAIESREAYRWLDEARDSTGRESPGISRIDVLKKEYQNGAIDRWTFFNSFQGVVASRFPAVKHTITALYRCGALYSCLSGSGSSLYGLYASDKEAASACKELQTEYPLVEIAKPLQKLRWPDYNDGVCP